LRRYLIHHDPQGTWDLILDDGIYSVEHALNDQRTRFSLEQFEASEDGTRLAGALTVAIARSVPAKP
jgi:hypothetical protein